MKLKNDRYRKARGGRAQLLKLYCESCGAFLFIYQKDGPGILKRLYTDRIQDTKKPPAGAKLICSKCKTLLGVPIIYKKEKRAAIRLFAGAIIKKK